MFPSSRWALPAGKNSKAESDMYRRLEVRKGIRGPCLAKPAAGVDCETAMAGVVPSGRRAPEIGDSALPETRAEPTS